MDSHYYEVYRDNIQSGDLIAWSKDKGSYISNLFLKIVRFFTCSEYGHTSIAWRIGGRLFIIEATTPTVRIVPLSSHDEFYHVPMKLEWHEDYSDYLLEKVGLPYSFTNAVKAYFGIRLKNDNSYQCAELANNFYKNTGLDLGDSYTPSSLVKAVLNQCDTSIHFVTVV